MPPRVLITETLDAQCADWLAQRAEVVWTPFNETERFHQLLPTADALVVRTYTQVDDALLDRAPRLKVIGRAGVGLDNIDLDACRARGIPVVYTPDANTQAVVEYVIGLMLDAYRPRPVITQPITAAMFHQCRADEVGSQLEKLTLGILGFGRIGKRLGEVAHAIGMNLHVNDLLGEVELRKAVDFAFQYVSFEELLSDSDIVSIHVDGRASNRHLINAKALSRLCDHCLLINTSRGMVIDNAALADWARHTPAGRAILDVHDPEPPPADYPLWNLDNVLLLPHLASRTDTALQNMSWVVRDVAAVLEGQSSQYPA